MALKCVEIITRPGKHLKIGDEGTEIILAITTNGLPANLSSAINVAMVFRKPSGEVLVVPAEIEGDPEEGRIRVLTGRDEDRIELDEPGPWLVQGRAETPDGRWHAAIGEFGVARVIQRWDD
jgi:hypothetical protein